MNLPTIGAVTIVKTQRQTRIPRAFIMAQKSERVNIIYFTRVNIEVSMNTTKSLPDI